MMARNWTAPGAFTQWRGRNIEAGHRISTVCSLFYGGPTRWGAFANDGGEVSAFVTFPLHPEKDCEVANGP